jgi:hypothetical protein
VNFFKKTFGCCEDGNCLRMGKRPFKKLPTLKKRGLLEQLDAEDKIRAIQVAMCFVYSDCVDNLNIEFVKAVMPHCTNDQWIIRSKLPTLNLISARYKYLRTLIASQMTARRTRTSKR